MTIPMKPPNRLRLGAIQIEHKVNDIVYVILGDVPSLETCRVKAANVFEDGLFHLKSVGSNQEYIVSDSAIFRTEADAIAAMTRERQSKYNCYYLNHDSLDKLIKDMVDVVAKSGERNKMELDAMAARLQEFIGIDVTTCLVQ